MTVVVHKVPLNLARTVSISDQYPGGSYERFQRAVTLTQDAFTLYISAAPSATGFLYPKYGLLFGDGVTPGVERATYTRLQPTHKSGKFVGTLGPVALPSGPRMLEIVAYDAAGALVVNPLESMVPYWINIDLDGTAKDHPDVIFQTGNYEWMHGYAAGSNHYWARVPKTLVKTRVVPQQWWHIPSVETPINQLAPGRFPGGEPFNTPISASQISRFNFAPTFDAGTSSIMRRPSFTKRGIMVTENVAGYSGLHFHAQHPHQPMLDGERGEAVVAQMTALEIGHAGSVYGCNSFSFARLSTGGKRVTFAGLRHKRAPYWEEMDSTMPEVEVVGDWDPSIPADKRWPWECWGIYADKRMPLVDPALPFAERPPFGLLPQHTGEGPAFYMTCRFGRVLKAQFHKDRPTDYPTMTEFVTGMSDPWGLANDDVSVMFVAQRTAHKISMLDMDDGSSLGDLLVNPNGNAFGEMDNVTWRRWNGLGTTLAQRRAQPFLAPEGLRYQDEYVYWGAYATNDVRRVKTKRAPTGRGRVLDGPIEIVCQVPIFADQSRFIAIAISDGTFGPRGTIFTTTYDNQTNGRPRAYLPTPGVAPDGTPLTHSVGWTWQASASDLVCGPGSKPVGSTTSLGTAPSGYTLGLDVGNGMLTHSGTQHGLSIFTKTLPGEPKPDYARLTRGHAYYRAAGHELLHGGYGYGHCAGIPLPWGENADTDYWLEWHGHSQVVVPPPPPADTTPPDTTIVDFPVDNRDGSAHITFTGTDDQAGVLTFESSFNGGPWLPTTSPVDRVGDPPGDYTLSVRGRDPAGNTDNTPATVSWKILPPLTQLERIVILEGIVAAHETRLDDGGL